MALTLGTLASENSAVVISILWAARGGPGEAVGQ